MMEAEGSEVYATPCMAFWKYGLTLTSEPMSLATDARRILPVLSTMAIDS